MSLFDYVRVGDQVYVAEGGEVCGAVRHVYPKQGLLLVWVENGGDFKVPADAIRAAHDGKVVLDEGALEPDILHAISQAHVREDPRY